MAGAVEKRRLIASGVDQFDGLARRRVTAQAVGQCRGRSEDELGFGVIDLSGRSSRSERAMQWHMDDADGLDGQVHDDPLVAVVAPESDAVAWFDAEPVQVGGHS